MGQRSPRRQPLICTFPPLLLPSSYTGRQHEKSVLPEIFFHSNFQIKCLNCSPEPNQQFCLQVPERTWNKYSPFTSAWGSPKWVLIIFPKHKAANVWARKMKFPRSNSCYKDRKKQSLTSVTATPCSPNPMRQNIIPVRTLSPPQMY